MESTNTNYPTLRPEASTFNVNIQHSMTRTEAQLTNDIIKAISEGELDRMVVLLDEWYSIFSTPPPFKSWLELACTSETVPIVSLLLSRGAYVSGEIVLAVCSSDNTDILQAFVDSGWDINTDLGPIGDLTIISVFLPTTSVLKWALANGADPNSYSNFSRNALEIALLNKFPEHVELLIAAGAHINNTNALKVAASQGTTQMIELLLEKGADINEIPRPDYSDLPGPSGTALHEAVVGDQLAAVQLLLEKGADPTLKNTAGKTPLELAQELNRPAVVEVLERRLGTIAESRE